MNCPRNLLDETPTSNQQKQRELLEILARDNGVTSDALSLGVVKDVASIGSSVVSAVHDLFSGK